MNTTENNKLIAEFMGLKDSEWNEKLQGIEWKIQTKGLKYHSSWDWLMPVVDKIEELELEIPYSYSYSIGNTENGFSGNRKADMIITNVFLIISKGEVRLVMSDNGCTTDELYNKGSKLENTYKAVVEFIKWYNQQNK